MIACILIFYHCADIAAGGQFVPEDVIDLVSTCKCFSTDSGSLALGSLLKAQVALSRFQPRFSTTNRARVSRVNRKYSRLS